MACAPCLTKGFADYFASCGADAFCLQETKMQPGQADFAPEGYAQYWNSAERRAIPARDFHPKAAAVRCRWALGVESTTTRAA